MYGLTLSFSGRAVRTAQARLLLGLSFLLTVGGLHPVLAQTAESAITPVRLVPDGRSTWTGPSAYYHWAHTSSHSKGKNRKNHERELVRQVRVYENAMNRLQLLTRDLKNTNDGASESRFAQETVARAFRPGGLADSTKAGVQREVDVAMSALRAIYPIKSVLDLVLRDAFALDRNKLDPKTLMVPGTDVSFEHVLSRFIGPEIHKAIYISENGKPIPGVSADFLMTSQLNSLFQVRTAMQRSLLATADTPVSGVTGLVDVLRGQLKQLASLEKTGLELREVYRPKVSEYDLWMFRDASGRSRVDDVLNDMKRRFRTARNQALATKRVGAPLVVMVGSLGFSVAADAGEAVAVSNTADEASESPSFESQSWARPSSRNRVSRGVRR